MIDAGASALVVKPQAVKKESANFFGSKYDLRSYSPSRHDSFYINYINQIIKIVKHPIIFMISHLEMALVYRQLQ